MLLKMKCFLLVIIGLMLAPYIGVYADKKPVSNSIALVSAAKPKIIRKPWVKYYDSKLPSKAFDAFDLIVLDPQYHPQLQPLLDRGKTLIGYLNAGEVEERERFYKAVRKEGILFKENERWAKSYYVDVRDKRWVKRVIEELIPRILHKGFHGLFLDTLDNAIELENTDPEQFKGMKRAAINLVKAIRYHYPTIPIILNRAFDILPELGHVITMVQAESIYTSYDMKTKTYGLNKPEFYERELKILKGFQKQFPDMRILNLEYADPNDTERIKEIYKKQRAHGFEPHVSVIGLDKIIPEPK